MWNRDLTVRSEEGHVDFPRLREAGVKLQCFTIVTRGFPFIGGFADLMPIAYDFEFRRGVFRVRGDVIDVFPAESSETAVRVTLFDDETGLGVAVATGPDQAIDDLHRVVEIRVEQDDREPAVGSLRQQIGLSHLAADPPRHFAPRRPPVAL